MAEHGVLEGLPREAKRWMAVGLKMLEYTEADIKKLSGMTHFWQREWNQRYADTGGVAALNPADVCVALIESEFVLLI